MENVGSNLAQSTFNPTLLLIGWCGCAILMILLYLINLLKRDAGIMDVGWALGLGCLAIFYAVAASGDPVRRMSVGTVASIWAFRLSIYLFLYQIWKKSHKDGRYRIAILAKTNYTGIAGIGRG